MVAVAQRVELTLDVPACPVHPGSSVVRSGKAQRKSGPVQRFRCRPVDGDEHLFVAGSTPTWTKPAPGLQVVCRWHHGSRVTRHGYVVSRGIRHVRFLCESDDAGRHTFALPEELLERPTQFTGVLTQTSDRMPAVPFTSHDIAEALVAIGAGSTFRHVAASLRPTLSWRVPAEWVEVFGQPICRRVLPDVWPSEVMVGWRPLGNDTTLGLLVAAERTAEQDGQLIAARVADADEPDVWQEFFSSLQGAPAVVIGDHSLAARTGLVQAFGDEATWRSSHYHLRSRLRSIARKAGMEQAGDAVVACLKSPDAFAAFCAHVHKAYPGSSLETYVRSIGNDVEAELAELKHASGFASTSSAMTGPLSDNIVRSLAPRRGRLTRADRLSCLVNLMVAHARGVDDVETYESVIRRSERATLH